MTDKNVYLDNAATTRTDDRVVEAMLPFLREDYGNASGKYSLGYRSRKEVEKARAKVATLIGAEPDEIYFTCGGTESNNTVLKGAKWSTIITTGIEHPSILNVLKKGGISGNIRYLQCDKTGMVNISDAQKLLKESGSKTGLLSVMMVNNELGTCEPVEKLAEIAHENGYLFHTDAVQALGHMPINVKTAGIDFLSASAHKFYGPKGIGFLYKKRGVKLDPLTLGGGQEREMRPGTENVPAIVGLGMACELAQQEMTENRKAEAEVLRVLESGLTSIPDSKVIGSGERILNIAFKGLNGTSLAIRLDVEGVCVSTGSACSSGLEKRSHVLDHIGVEPKFADASVRISIGKYNTVDEAVYVSEKIGKLVAELRELNAV